MEIDHRERKVNQSGSRLENKYAIVVVDRIHEAAPQGIKLNGHYWRHLYSSQYSCTASIILTPLERLVEKCSVR